MADTGQIEKRLSALEQQVAAIEQSLHRPEPAPNWLDGFIGSFKDYPDFDEIVRLGKEYRQSQRPETHG